MEKLKKMLQLFSFVMILGMLLSGATQAELIIWVGENGANMVDSLGVPTDQGFIDLLEGAGYTVQTEYMTMQGAPLTTEQFDILESGDLIIISRTTSSGSYIDPAGWNSISKPIIVNSVYIIRSSRWQWFNTGDLINNGRSGAPALKAEIPDHPIFTGVTPDADGLYYPLDPAIGCGNTSFFNWAEAGDDGIIIATSVTPDTLGAVEGAVGIVYWPVEATFYPETDQFAGGPRLLLPCGTQEDAGICPKQGLYNLTPVGDQLFLNSVAWMLGKEVGVEANPTVTPADFKLAQNFPNPFNPSTTIEFSLPTATTAKLSVYNMLGQKVVTLADRSYQPGTYTGTWDGLDSSGRIVESGVYLYKLEAENFSLIKKMLLIK
ncbi:T9SS type A sorting domain-containing protein [candidate division KSB1 bacterium]|nr:T9SS type A sorting domain-containing protein [candidate division KSB1 bacterium]